ncbi:MAG TPA: DUF1918 domain-containing protein [Jatrophihabitantaceae bacterium]|jgi:hypothetical protein
MHAKTGDWLVVKSRTTGRPARRGEIVAVGTDGAPPFRVRWTEDDHEAMIFPGPDAEVVDAGRQAELDREQADRIASVQSFIEAKTAPGRKAPSTPA